MTEVPGGDGVAHENRDGDDVPEQRHAAGTAREDDTPASSASSVPEKPDALDERDELSGQRMVKIEPGPGEGDDELALRRLFQGAVGGLEPSLGSLEHLRRAVPARRARKRQAIVGAAAAAVLIGTAVPAFVHVAASGGISDPNPANAAHGEQSQGGTGTATGVEGGQSSKGPASSVSPSPDPTDSASGKPQQPGTGPTATGPQQSAGADPGSTPRCSAGQLAVAQSGAGGMESDGKVHGTFRIANVSGSNCLVDGAGIVSFEARGAADPGSISVVRHTSGDGSGLPDPSQESFALVLKPNGSYEVKFAWVPSETCPTTGGTPTPTPTTPTEPTPTPDPTPTPTPTPTDDPTSGAGGSETGGGAGTEAGTGVTPQLLLEGQADGSIVVTHTAESGGPTASAVVTNACAGTIYRTGVLPGS
ncbi:hypothetical protein ACFTWS_13540 [Streptomyces sp. NPDC057027]|uniref:hypothetical protein n=1 Tax=Streptomyces sp. NPDC057027 TaxID=3346004 RepID=UPI00363C2E3A